MKKIMFFINNFGEGGAQRVVSLLSKKFLKKKYSVEICIKEPNKNIAYELPHGIKVSFFNDFIKNEKPLFFQSLKLKIYKVLMILFPKNKEVYRTKSYYDYYGDRFVTYVNKKGVDVIFAILAESSMVAGNYAKKINARIITCERNYPLKPYYTKEFLTIREKAFENSDFSVFQTQEQREFFSKKTQEKSVVIPNPIKEDLPVPFNGKRRKVIVNYCGFREQKNIPLFIKAFGKVYEIHKDYSLEIYGKGELEKELKDLVENMGLESVVSLLPFDPNIHEKVNDCSMFVMTSDYEGMPNSLIEAMGIGLPVISTDCDGGGAKALIENNINGILIPKGDIEACANAMLFYIENPKIAEKYAKEAIKVRENFSLNKITQQWISLF